MPSCLYTLATHHMHVPHLNLFLRPLWRLLARNQPLLQMVHLKEGLCDAKCPLHPDERCEYYTLNTRERINSRGHVSSQAIAG